MAKERIGYKAMESDMTCRGFQFEIGKTYEIEGELKICKNGFHFCMDIFNTLRYYPNRNGTIRFFKIAYDEYKRQGDKRATNKITILEEIDIFHFIPLIEKSRSRSKRVSLWKKISSFQKLSESFIIEHKKYIDWYFLNWKYLSEHQKLSEGFIEKHEKLLYWDMLSACQELSENFIRKHKKLVEWELISIHQKLSENFIIEHKDYVNWKNIRMYQNISKHTIEKYS